MPLRFAFITPSSLPRLCLFWHQSLARLLLENIWAIRYLCWGKIIPAQEACIVVKSTHHGTMAVGFNPSSAIRTSSKWWTTFRECLLCSFPYTNSIFTTTLWSNYYDYLHLTDKPKEFAQVPSVVSDRAGIQIQTFFALVSSSTAYEQYWFHRVVLRIKIIHVKCLEYSFSCDILKCYFKNVYYLSFLQL